MITTSAQSATLSEAAEATNTAANAGDLTATGTLDFNDLDEPDTFTADVIGVAASGTLGSYSASDDATLLALMTAPSGGAVTETGGIAWSFTGGEDLFDYLANGDSLALAYTIQVTDNNGDTGTQTVTITIDGANDAPQLTGSAATLADGTEDLTYDVSEADLLAGWTDIDLGDKLSVAATPTASVGSVALNGSGDGYTVTLPADYNGTVTLTYAVTDGITSTAATIDFEVNADADPDTITPASNLDTSVLTGSGDLLIGSGIPGDNNSWQVATDSTDAPGVEIGLNTSLRFTGGFDIDGNGDYVVPAGAAGGTPQDNTGTSDDDGWARWNLQVSVGTDTDGNGGTLGDRDYIFTLSNADASGNPSGAALLSFTMDDVAAAAVAAVGSPYPDTASFLAQSVYQGSLNLEWLLDSTTGTDLPADFDPTAPGYFHFEVKVQNKVNDSVELTNSINIRVNEAPVGNDDTDSGTIVEAGEGVSGTDTATGNVLDNDTDQDLLRIPDVDELMVTDVDGTSVSGTTSISGTYGDLSIDEDGSWTYTLDDSLAATQALTVASGATETFIYTVEDPDGESDTATLSIEIAGSNDAPVITVGTGSAADTLTETNSGLMTSGTLDLEDVDTTDTVTVSSAFDSATRTGPITALPAGLTNAILDGFLSVPGGDIIDNASTTDSFDWTFNSNSEAFDFLAAGETLTLRYNITAQDSQAQDSVAQQVVITINGTNDVPVITVNDLVDDTEGDSLDTSVVPAMGAAADTVEIDLLNDNTDTHISGFGHDTDHQCGGARRERYPISGYGQLHQHHVGAGSGSDRCDSHPDRSAFLRNRRCRFL